MARLDQGLLGGYSGKLGTTVGATWKGINVVRTYQPNVANPNTQKQRDHRTKFSDIAKLGSFYLDTMVKPFWERGAKKMSGYNAFVRANVLSMKDSQSFFASELVIGNGQMGRADMTFAPELADGLIVMQWDKDETVLWGKPTDKLFVLVFNYAEEVIGASLGEETRKDAGVAISTIEGTDLSEAHIVWAWLSEDGLSQSITTHEERTFR